MSPVCNFLLVLLNGCNTTSFLPQVMNNCTQAIQLPSTGCICPCQTFPNFMKLCDMSNATIPPCATATTKITESTETVKNKLSSTTPRLPVEDDEIFDDEGKKRKQTTITSTILKSSTSPYPISSTVKTTSIIVEDNQKSPSPPDSSDQKKDKTTTQSINDDTTVHTTPSSRVSSTTSAPSSKSISLTPTSVTTNLRSSTERTMVARKKSTPFATTCTSDEPSLTNTSIPGTFDVTTTPSENPTNKHVSPSDQSPSSSSIYTTQSSMRSRKTTKYTVSKSSTPQYEDNSIKTSTPENLNTITTSNPKILTTKPSTTDDITSESPYKFTLLPTMSTVEDEIFHDEGNRRKTTTKTLTTSESVKSTTAPYPITRMTTERSDGSISTVTTESTIEVESTTPSINETDCDLTDQSQDKSIDPLDEAELTSLQRTKRSLFNYSTELSKVLLKNDTSNIAVSPINFALLLAMMRTGCRSPMKEELDKILRISPNITENRLKIFKSIVDSLDNITNISNVEIYMANKMYLPKTVNISSKFGKMTQTIFQSEPQTIDFTDVNSTVKQLNNWSSNYTNNKIPTFTDANHLNSSTSVLLTSVAYFSGNWSKPFERQFTSKNLFYIDETTKKSVCTMIQVNKFRYGQLSNLGVEFVELPFKSDDNDLAMILMLPLNGTTLDSVAENLDKLKSSDFINNSTLEVVYLSLPKFRIESVVDLTKNPEEFGLSRVTAYSSDFKCFCKKESLQISHIVQKTVIDVHEGGCNSMNFVCPEVEQRCNSSSINFTVNQPFIVLIINSDMILFSGRVNDPGS